MNRAERRRQKRTKSERQAVEPGEIKVFPNGDVVIGAPTATASAVAPPIGNDEEGEG